jgi:tripartite-type tricarboxylate transporter receptor subunit TctC
MNGPNPPHAANVPTTPAQFRAKIDADLARWSPVIKALDLKIN